MIEEKLVDFLDEHFVIDDLSKAEWAVKKIVEQQNIIDSMKTAAVKMKEEYNKKVDDWLEKSVNDIQADVDSLSSMLLPFISSQLEGKKKRSISLPSGTVGFRKGSTSFSLNGEKVDGKSDQLLNIVKLHNLNEYVVTKESVDWANLKKTLKVNDGKVITADGELLQDMTAQTEPDKFYVKAGN